MHGGKHGFFIIMNLLALCRRYCTDETKPEVLEALDVAIEEVTWLLDQMVLVMKEEEIGQGNKRRMEPNQRESVPSKRFPYLL